MKKRYYACLGTPCITENDYRRLIKFCIDNNYNEMLLTILLAGEMGYKLKQILKYDNRRYYNKSIYELIQSKQKVTEINKNRKHYYKEFRLICNELRISKLITYQSLRYRYFCKLYENGINAAELSKCMNIQMQSVNYYIKSKRRLDDE